MYYLNSNNNLQKIFCNRPCSSNNNEKQQTSFPDTKQKDKVHKKVPHPFLQNCQTTSIDQEQHMINTSNKRHDERCIYLFRACFLSIDYTPTLNRLHCGNEPAAASANRGGCHAAARYHTQLCGSASLAPCWRVHTHGQGEDRG